MTTATTPTPAHPPVFNLPNQLTASRFVLALVLFVLIEMHLWVACLAVFTLAAITDWLDGYLARRQGLVSTLGRNLDPLVDKVLVCGAYIFLLPDGDREGWLRAWMVTLVVARELVITGLRSFMENMGAKFGADWLGKVKMVLQCAALIFIFLALEARDSGSDLYGMLRPLRDFCLYAMLAATLLSGLQYLWRAFAVLRESQPLT
jgi:CDP-diacylglycerol--glycerol-3-phosphate 3-phosphatidyltransferase